MSTTPAAKWVGMGEFLVTKDPASRLSSCSIGSCLAVTAHDPKAGVAGMIHFILPNSQLDPPMATVQPCMFGAFSAQGILGV